MNLEEDTFVTYRRKSRYTKEHEFEDIQLEDTNSDMDPIGIHSDRGKGTGEVDKLEFRNLVSALNDLAKGQKEVLHAINRLALKPETGHSSIPLSPVDRYLPVVVGSKHTLICKTHLIYITNLPAYLLCLTSWRMQ